MWQFQIFLKLLNWKLFLTLGKVFHWNSFRINPKFSESFWNLYSHQTVSFRSNPKLVFNPSQSELIRGPFKINPNQSELVIQINPVNPNYSELIRTLNLNDSTQSELSIRSIRTFNPNEYGLSGLSESIRMIAKNSVSFGLTGFIRIVSSD